MQMNTTGVESKIVFVHISIIEEICLITSNHDIFISKSRDSLLSFSFFKLTLLEGCDKIVKLESGSTFLSFLTETERFFTNYKDDNDYHSEFHEIERFAGFNITDFKCGLDYMILQGVPKVDAFGIHVNRMQQPLLSKVFTEETWEDYESQIENTFSQTPTKSHQKNLANTYPISYKNNILFHKSDSKIKFIENGVEIINQSDEEGIADGKIESKITRNYLGEPTHCFQEDIFDQNDKEITKQMIMRENYNRISQTKTRIKTPRSIKGTFLDSSSGTTNESDHTVDDELNQKQVKVENHLIKYIKRAKDRWLEFENNCKGSNTVIPNGKLSV